MRQPDIIRMSYEWMEFVLNTAVETDEGYLPARPYGLSSRWKAAWLVFCGKADALIWPGEQ